MATNDRAVFLDRDGVINAMWWDPEHGTVDSPVNPDQFQLLPMVPEAIRRLRALGLRVVVVSNQPGIAKGKMTQHLLDAITRKMEDHLRSAGASVDRVYYCLHHPEALVPAYRQICECRKPRPDLLRRAAEELGIDLERSYMVGDGLNDVQAGMAVGCTTIWLGNLKCEICKVMDENAVRPDHIASNLYEATQLIQELEDSRGNIHRLGKP